MTPRGRQAKRTRALHSTTKESKAAALAQFHAAKKPDFMNRPQSETNGGAPTHAPDSRNPFIALIETLNLASSGGFDTAHFDEKASAWPDPDATLDDVLTLCNEALKDGWQITPAAPNGSDLLAAKVRALEESTKGRGLLDLNTAHLREIYSIARGIDKPKRPAPMTLAEAIDAFPVLIGHRDGTAEREGRLFIDHPAQFIATAFRHGHGARHAAAFIVSLAGYFIPESWATLRGLLDAIDSQHQEAAGRVFMAAMHGGLR